MRRSAQVAADYPGSATKCADTQRTYLANSVALVVAVTMIGLLPTLAVGSVGEESLGLHLRAEVSR
jgi:hypothetical protein